MTSKREKAETIFNWVQENITYVAFEDGLGGFIPRGAASVCDKRYGDCKDMANLLYEMLNHVSVETYRTWIGSRNRPYSYYDVPTPIVDNHMISATVIENDTIFLDATDSFVPFGYPSAFTQGKEALIGIDESNFSIKKVPVPSPEKSITAVNTEIFLENQTITVNETRTLSGFEKVDYLQKFTYEKDDKTEEEFLNTTLALGNNKTKYNNITHKHTNNKETPLELSYNLSIDNYSKTVGNKTFINLNIDRVLSKSKIDIEDRKYSRKIDYKHQKQYQTVFHIPEGYTVSSVPKERTFEHEDYSYTISYTLEDNKVIQNKIISINTLSIKKEQFESWNAFIKSLIKAYKKSITLEKIS
ncbi:MAG: transglutaminase domain-containing protein, partial [Flavobacteriaceae bacterium]|nr:transglutaminase domain-containing protein [Flavobacteriaceae bacterium]